MKAQKELNALENKVAVITGGASGIGKAAAIKFAAEGASVVIADIDESHGHAAIAEMSGANHHFVHCDVSSAASVRALFKTVKKAYQRLDVLYNNASIYLNSQDNRITELEEEVWDKVIAVNLKSVYLCCHYGIPLLLRNGGVIINTASSAGVIGIPNCDAYTASKGATVQLTKSLAVEYGPYGVRCNCIAPAAIMTEMMRQSNPVNSSFDEESFLRLRTPLRRYGKAEEIAAISCFLASDAASYLNGAILAADGGITVNGDLSKPV